MNEEFRQQSHDYCLLGDPGTKGSECFDSAFLKVDIYLADKLCFEKMQESIENLKWINELRSKFIEACSLT